MLSRAMTIIAAVFLFNMMACSKAKFEATDTTNRQAQPAPDNVTTNGSQDPNSGDVVSCSNVNSQFCNNDDDGFQDTIPPITFTPPTCNVHQPIPTNFPDRTCYENIFQNSTKGNINGVNVWLVVDSSRSFDQARLAVGRAVSRSFLASLQHKVPVTVSIIPAHAPSSSYGSATSYNGRIYGEATFRPTMTSSQVAAAEANLLSRLDSAMQESPISLAKRNRQSLDGLNYASSGSSQILGGPNSGSDEMGLDSFMAAMENYSIPANNAWVVMFLADENDICARELSHNGSIYYSHYNEAELFNRGYCNGVSADIAYNRAKAYAGNRPFAVGAMTYLDYNTIPNSAHAQSSVGIGYTRMAGLAKTNGKLIDLAASSAQGLDSIATKIIQSLGQVTNNSVGFHTHYPIYDNSGNRVNLKDVFRWNDNGTIKLDLKVYVGPTVQSVSGISKESYRSNYSYSSADSLVMPANKNTVVRIEYCVGN